MAELSNSSTIKTSLEGGVSMPPTPRQITSALAANLSDSPSSKPLPVFELERYFAQYEFRYGHVHSTSPSLRSSPYHVLAISLVARNFCCAAPMQKPSASAKCLTWPTKR